MDDVIVREISVPSKEYDQSLLLRDKILCKPLGLNLFDRDLSQEPHDVHVGAYSGQTLIGILILTKINNSTVKMRQVAVDSDCQGRGVGGHMVRFAEQIAQKCNFSSMALNARETAVAFYRSLGYHTRGERFLEVGIPHYAMDKPLL